MSEKIRVKMADLKVGVREGVIITSGLGSCVGVTLYDEKRQVGGMAHVMLPEHPNKGEKGNPAKYADTALEMLLEEMDKMQARQSRLEAKIAGGAQMFSFSNGNGNKKLRIGERNIKAVKEELAAYNIPLIGEEVGKDYGRTMELDLETGDVAIKTVKFKDIIL